MVRWAVWTVVLAAVLGGFAIWQLMRVGGDGERAIERWIGRQLTDLAEAHLTPKLAFSRLDYRYPLTVEVEGVRLTVDDPRNPSQQLEVMSADRATITLRELPREGQPLRIQRIAFQQPALRLVLNDTRDGFVGISNLVKAREQREAAVRQKPQTRLSDVLQIRHLEMIGGFVEYDTRTDGVEPMRLERLGAVMDIQPGAPGDYALSATFGRPPLGEVATRALLNTDTLQLRDVELRLKSEVGPDNLGFLPPQLQRLFKQYDIRGRLDATVTGTCELMKPDRSVFQVHAELVDGHVALSQYHIAVERATVQMSVADSTATLNTLRVQALGGEADLSGEVRLSRDWYSRVQAEVRAVRLERLLASSTEALSGAESSSSMSGQLDGSVRIEGPMRLVAGKFRNLRRPDAAPVSATRPWPSRWGTGTAEISNGNLVQIPVISKIYQGVLRSASRVLGRKGGDVSQSLRLVFSLEEDRIQFSEITYVGSVLAARGRGELNFNRELDLRLNGGPVERLQELMGGNLGAFWGRLTDSVATYRVTGRLSEPRVRLELAPGLFGRG